MKRLDRKQLINTLRNDAKKAHAKSFVEKLKSLDPQLIEGHKDFINVAVKSFSDGATELDLTPATIGQIIESVRKEAKLTQEQLGALTNISASGISKIENAEVDVSLSNFLTLCRKLGIRLKVEIDDE